MKTTVTHLLATTFAATTIFSAHAEPYYDSYTDSNGICYSYSVEDGCATITDVSYSYMPYDPYNNPSGYGYIYWDGYIPETVGYNDGSGTSSAPVTAIGDNAFYNLMSSLYSSSSYYGSTSIYLPSTVKRVGDYAFQYGSGGEMGMGSSPSIGSLPDGLEYLGYKSFDGCYCSYDETTDSGVNLLNGWAIGYEDWYEGGYSGPASRRRKTIDLSSAKGLIGGLFQNTEKIKTILLPTNLKVLPKYTFDSCTDLTEIVIPATVTNIEEHAFSNASSLSNITFVGNAPDVGSDAFYGVSQDCVVFVQQGTTGWGTVPGTWNGLETRYTTQTLTYTVTWLDEDGTVLDTEDAWIIGATPTHEEPTKASDVQYSYTFAGWTPAIETVRSNTTYRATYTPHLRGYTITWNNEKGGRINTTTVAYGSVPTHADATKAADAFYTYTFAGWAPTPVAVTGPATYMATFTPIAKYAGSGTESDPFVATSKDDLVNLIAATNNLFVQLAAGLSVTGPITVPASMTAISIDMNGGTISGANGDAAVVLVGDTAFSAKGTGTISADSGIEAVQRPGSVAAASGVTITGMGGDVASTAFGAEGKAITTGITQGTGNTWTLTAFAELESGTAEGMEDSAVKVYRANTLEDLQSATPLSNGVTVREKKNAVKVELEVSAPTDAPSQFFKVSFGE